MRHVDRRRFLEAAALGSAAVTLTGTTAAAARSAADTLVVGVMGMGGRGTTLATEFQRQDGVEVKYVADVDEGRANSAARRVADAAGGKPTAIADFRRIVDDGEVDILVVATCNHWHAPATVMACNAGKHVYVEKPASHNAHEGELMVEAARKHDRRVQLGTQRRSWPKVREAIQRLHEGVIGRAYYAHCYYTNVRPTIGRGKATDAPADLDYDLWQGPAPRRPFRDNYLHYNWHWFWHWGNGELGNNGVHMIDVARWGLGVELPVRVDCMGGRYRYDDDQQTPDTTIATFDFAGGRSIRWEGISCCRMPTGKSPGDVVFYGEKGSLRIDAGGYTLHDDRGNETEKVTGPGDNAGHVGNLVGAVRGEEDLRAEIREGHLSTHLCNLGNIAYRKGRSLVVDPKSGRIVKDDDAMTLWKRDYEPGWEPKVS